MNIEIREARKEDAEDIQRLYYRTWIDTYVCDALDITKEKLEKRFRDLLLKESIEWLGNFIDKGKPENHRYLVAADSGKVVGVMYLEKELDHNRIQGLYILPEYQGKGIGTRLWQEACKFIDKKNKTILDVAEYNKKAIGFYEKLGFVDSGKRFMEEVSNPDDVQRPMTEMVLVQDVWAR